MNLEPSTDQLKQLHHLPPGKLALVNFMAYKDQIIFDNFRSATGHEVVGHKGIRTHDLHIDQILAGGKMPYNAITVDIFVGMEPLKRFFDAVQTEHQAVLTELYTLIVSPSASQPQIAKRLGFLAPLLSRLLGTRSERAVTEFAKHANPATGPVPETVAELRKYDQTTPFYMMNLNKYFSTAQYKNGETISGERAYNRYANTIAPYLISVGGFPDIIGKIEAVFVWDQNSTLHDNWSDFAMVYYPSRAHFLRLMTNSPRKGIHHRSAGLEKAVLMPSSINSEGGCDVQGKSI